MAEKQEGYVDVENLVRWLSVRKEENGGFLRGERHIRHVLSGDIGHGGRLSVFMNGDLGI